MMKLVSSILALLLTTSAVGQQTSQGTGPDKALASAAAQDPNVAKAHALLEKMVTALGGEAYLTYTTMMREGRTYSFYQGQPNSAGAPFWSFWKYPDKERIELTKKRDIIYIYNDDKGYEITYKGTAAVEAKDLTEYLRRREHSMERIVREWMKDPATLVFYSGTALADQNMVEQVTLIDKNNDAVTIGIDPNTFLPLKKSYTYRDAMDNLKDTDDEVFANYRPIQGIQTPLSVVRLHNGLMSGQRFFSKVEYNVPIEDSKFQADVNYDPYSLPKKKK